MLLHRPACALSLAFPLLASAAIAAQAPPTPSLKTAKDLLAKPDEQSVRSGARICAQANNVAGVTLLLGVLKETHGRGLPPAHYRDIAWESLIQITDLYAQKRVAAELKKNRKNAFVRQWCAELLGIYGQPAWVPSLVKALHDKNAGVRRWAVRSLGKIGNAAATEPVRKLVQAKDIYVRSNAIEALARIDPKQFGETLVQAIRDDKDGGVRCALLGAAKSIFPERAEEISAARLVDEDWRPRMQAVDNLADIKTKSCIDALLTVVDDGRPVVAKRVLERLRNLTGQQLTRPEIWRKWWKENRATFQFPDGLATKKLDEGKTVASFNGIQVTSDHVAFLIDKSVRMGIRLASRGVTKAAAARDELKTVLDKLSDKVVVNVFTYAIDVKAFAKKPLHLSKRVRTRAVAFLGKQKTGRAKDIWKVLERVITDPSLDTAYLLSSGEPDVGTYVHWNRVTRHLRDLNRFHKVTVHTVAYSDSKWFRDQLEKISECTGGEFRWFQ